MNSRNRTSSRRLCSRITLCLGLGHQPSQRLSELDANQKIEEEVHRGVDNLHGMSGDSNCVIVVEHVIIGLVRKVVHLGLAETIILDWKTSICF